MSTTTVATASPRQVAFITTLLAERVHEYSLSSEDLESLTIREASSVIDNLLHCPRIGVAAAPSALPQVAAGRYAVEIDGVLRFYVVTHGKGRWAGRVFVVRQSSDNELRISRSESEQALAAITADPRTATVRYGHELGVCGVCGRTLTDEESRAAGVGPVCAVRMGWYTVRCTRCGDVDIDCV